MRDKSISPPTPGAAHYSSTPSSNSSSPRDVSPVEKPDKDIKTFPSTTGRSKRWVRSRKSVDDIKQSWDRERERAFEKSSLGATRPPHLSPNQTSVATTSSGYSRPPSIMAGAQRVRARLRNPWSFTPLTLSTTVLAFILLVAIIQSFLNRQLDIKGCAMSYMRPAFAKFPDFDTEHTRFASKYALYLYREGGVDEDTRVKGVPVLFIPGNAGSYKQVRPMAAEAAVYFQETLQNDPETYENGKRPLDFFTADFNEDFTAFHGQTLLDQAEYLNEAVAYILSLYHNPHRSLRDPTLPDPTSVILIGHSMGGVVARTMVTLPNYQADSVNTILTLSAPHARPPVSFDSDIVTTYKRVNDYWRNSFAQNEGQQNPLSQFTVISIAGGGLDTVVPSDYSTIASLIPATHGFTVFTSTIPHVWSGMDHLAITWCDQLRKSIVKALYDIVDASRPHQSRPRPDRMRAFKRRFLTGLEAIAEKDLASKEPGTLLTLEDNSNAIISQGERLVLRDLGVARKPQAHLLPIPAQSLHDRKQFTLLTDQQLDTGVGSSKIDVMFCSVFPLHSGQTNQVFSMNMDLSGDTSGSTRLACKNAASDSVSLPASTPHSKFPFEERPPFSYIQYDLDYLSEHQFVAVIDKTSEPTNGWVFGEFSSATETTLTSGKTLWSLVTKGLDMSFFPSRSLVNEIQIPAVHSSLLAYNLHIDEKPCGEGSELFSPMLRQHIEDPYESKYFVNVEKVGLNLHGVSPFLPPALKSHHSELSLSLQLWSDPSCNNTMDVHLRVDLMGSMGKLWMRYRTVFAAFPLLVVALVLRKQFQVYDSTGLFISFTESMDHCLRRSVLVLVMGLTFLAMSLSKASQSSSRPLHKDYGASETAIDFTINDLLLGSQDPFFWFLIPMFGIMSVGLCIAANYVVLVITHVLSSIHSQILKLLYSKGETRRPPIFTELSTVRRVVTTALLLLFATFVTPYQALFIILCLVQLVTSVRALTLVRESNSIENGNFYNYVHSIFLLLLWILPINIPVVVVWVRNLTVHWLTPFSSPHNILAIVPFVILIETLASGRMVPRVPSWTRYLTNILFFSLAVYAAVYGVTFAYLLHSIVNIICMWLAVLHYSPGSSHKGFERFARIVHVPVDEREDRRYLKKRPE